MENTPVFQADLELFFDSLVFIALDVIGCLAICYVERKGKREHLKCGRNVALILGRGITHMISYCKRLFPLQHHIRRNHIHTLFTVAVRKLVVILKGIYSLPHALFVLDVSEAFFTKET